MRRKPSVMRPGGPPMPNWAGTWKGGRYYLNADGKPVFFIERLRRSIRLKTHDEELAKGQLATFLQDPIAFCRPPPEPEAPIAPVYITEERITLYMESIRKTCRDHRTARQKYLVAWGAKLLDLRSVDRRALRAALASFKGGHRGRCEALNAFGNFLADFGDLPSWQRLTNTHEPKKTRGAREAYDIETVTEAYNSLTSQRVKDVIHLRASTGLHHTEIAQLKAAPLFKKPLPDLGVGIRILGGEHEIQGVLQIRQKTKPRHRVSVNADTLRAALRLRESVPSRIAVWEALQPLIPSNLRHTFTTLRDQGEIISYTGSGVTLDQVAEILGHRVGSKMTASRYDKLQVPPMMKLPLNWKVL